MGNFITRKPAERSKGHACAEIYEEGHFELIEEEVSRGPVGGTRGCQRRRQVKPEAETQLTVPLGLCSHECSEEGMWVRWGGKERTQNHGTFPGTPQGNEGNAVPGPGAAASVRGPLCFAQLWGTVWLKTKGNQEQLQ